MEVLDLPPGFRFHPTDEEIITYYLTQKVINGGSFSATAIGEADLNKSEPWDLPQKAKMGEKEWYFYCQRDRKYPTGMRTNRATESGYWKATGKDKQIFQGKSCLVGMKKTLVFYKGRAPKGEKTNWVMHEYRLEGKFHHHHHLLLPKSVKDEWVVCRIFHKNVSMGFKRLQIPGTELPPLVDPTNPINIDTDSFNDVVFKQPIRNYAQLQANSSSDGMMMINVSQIRSNNNPEFTFFSSEKMMNYYAQEQQEMNSGPVVAAAADRSFVDIADVKNTPEISSVDDHYYEDFDAPEAISDLEHLWEY